MEKFCSQGHVIDIGKDTCSRCGGVAIKDIKEEIIEETSVIEEEKVEEIIEETPKKRDRKSRK